jgi:hypothetical protein
MIEDRDVQEHVREVLEPGEQLRVRAPASEATLAVTDRRLIVADANRVALAVPFERLRRIQFDVERSRPATLVIVPEHPRDEAQVLSIRPDQYEATAQALVAIGLELVGPAHDEVTAGQGS